ncbi:kinase-like domain-containing protein [Cokeromyces recurvatus]|uniref:kinase-like domain-containing protein n=1 Tax=Cokeromyces recurvatus TaxID=90255 RepID=UPI00221F4324|nr:kinase-like domain-containing protein [Cokeromyces recurvatus]KAI7904445.1 kinase-like domain-containing protein [Cokeromyces recurvatus]
MDDTFSSSMDRFNEVKPRNTITFNEKYNKLETLGRGNFGKVYLVENNETKEKYAAKVIDRKAFKSIEQNQHIERELEICKSFASDLNHPNIVQVYDVMIENDYIYIVMDYIEGGELFDHIRQAKGLSPSTSRRWFRQLIQAVDYIHKNNIIHRDLKPENIMIDKSQRLRICDFGFGNIVKRQHEVLNTYCGSPFYAAPEMVTATPYYGPPVDLWSCGVILYAMLTGSLPFQGGDMPALFHRISSGIYTVPSSVNKDAIDLISRLLCRDAKQRYSAEDCLNHPWLASSSSSSLSSQRTTNFFKHYSLRCFPISSHIALASRLTRKKIDILSTTSLIETKFQVTTKEDDNEIMMHSKRRPSELFMRVFRKKSQIKPISISKKNERISAEPIIENISKDKLNHSDSSSKKQFRSKYLFGKFRGFFNFSLQKRIT